MSSNFINNADIVLMSSNFINNADFVPGMPLNNNFNDNDCTHDNPNHNSVDDNHQVNDDILHFVQLGVWHVGVDGTERWEMSRL